MRRTAILILVLATASLAARADHITGGEMFFRLVSSNGANNTYAVTLKLFKWCESNRQLVNPGIISVFNKSSNLRITDLSVPIMRIETLRLDNTNKCITDPPRVCYEVAYFEFTVQLPVSVDGYILSFQVVYRISGITNFVPNNNNIGATYIGEIPGTAAETTGPANNSARFTGSDMVVVCAGNSFSYSFAADDSDGDLLSYSFCDAYQGGSGGFNREAIPPAAPPYASVPYSGTFTGNSPLGSNVRIDPNTGMITGIAPQSGIYVVTVCVNEIRNGKIIATQRKDLQLNITSCTIASASLEPEIMVCGETRSVALKNLSTSPLINTYNWDFIDQKGNSIYSSNASSAEFTFPDTGLYRIRLAINRGQDCADSSESIARVYPGFKPDFNYDGICLNRPTAFKDATTTVYGSVNSWQWIIEPPIGIFNSKNPDYHFTSLGRKNVQLIVSNTNGCIDTVSKDLSIVDKPPLGLGFNDTLICANDPLQLQANASGRFSWSPQTAMVNSMSASPRVSPASTTMYYVDLDDGGCTNRDSVLVRVVNKVDLEIMNDSVVCSNDPASLWVRSNGLRYSWSPAEVLDNPVIANPHARVNKETRFTVIASIGGCSAAEEVTLRAVPFPVADAGPDTTICFNSSVILKGNISGSSFFWSENIDASSRTMLEPMARPASSSLYILSVYDTAGCPKPGLDTCMVTVLPKVEPFAGRDTSVIIGQPLQLNASGGTGYLWTPSYALNASNIPNPLALFQQSSEGILYTVHVSNEAGCTDSASIRVKVFNSMAEVFVPNAFTPNGDGKNDRLNFVTAGIQKVESFTIYNRWGQLVYSSISNEAGWSGDLGGNPATSGTYVWIVKAIDFNGNPYLKKGTVTLIR